MNTEKHTYGSDPLRAPEIEAGEIEIYSEHGRDLPCRDDRRTYGVCFCSHWFKIVQEPHGGRYALLVKHGGGAERIRLGYESCGGIVTAMAGMDSDTRYLMMHDLHKLYRETKSITAAEEATKWRSAFVFGRLKKRKVRGSNSVKVWIESGDMLNSIPQKVRTI